MIPVFTLDRQNKILAKELTDTFSNVLSSGIFVLGKNVSQFESEFAQYIGVKYAVGVASGTDALILALLSLGISAGDEVIIAANAYPTAFTIASIGAIPKLVDIDPATYNIDPGKIEAVISKKTKAVIAVHLYGQPADLNTIMAVCDKHKLPVVEDCAQAHGAEICINSFSSKGPADSAAPFRARTAAAREWGSPPRVTLMNTGKQSQNLWKKVGGVGEAGCFSFYPTKNLGALGDGGMVVTNNKDVYNKIMHLRMYGEDSRYKSVMVGRISRLDELQAAFLSIKLKYLDSWNKKRYEIAHHYSTNNPGVSLPEEFPGSRSAYHLYVVRCTKRDKLRQYLAQKDIQTAVHYPTPVHLQESFHYLGYPKGSFPESEKACGEILSLPMFPELTLAEVDTINEVINQFD